MVGTADGLMTFIVAIESPKMMRIRMVNINWLQMWCRSNDLDVSHRQRCRLVSQSPLQETWCTINIGSCSNLKEHNQISFRSNWIVGWDDVANAMSEITHLVSIPKCKVRWIFRANSKDQHGRIDTTFINTFPRSNYITGWVYQDVKNINFPPDLHLKHCGIIVFWLLYSCEALLRVKLLELDDKNESHYTANTWNRGLSRFGGHRK